MIPRQDAYSVRSTSTLELNITTLRSLGSTAPTATPGVSTSSGGAIKIATWPNSTKNPFASLSVERSGLYPAKKTIPNSTATTSLQLRGKHTHNLLFSPSTTIRRRRGQRRWRRSRSNFFDEQTKPLQPRRLVREQIHQTRRQHHRSEPQLSQPALTVVLNLQLLLNLFDKGWFWSASTTTR